MYIIFYFLFQHYFVIGSLFCFYNRQIGVRTVGCKFAWDMLLWDIVVGATNVRHLVSMPQINHPSVFSMNIQLIWRFCRIFSLFFILTKYHRLAIYLSGTFCYIYRNCSRQLSDVVQVRSVVLVFRAPKTADLRFNPLYTFLPSQFWFLRWNKIVLNLHRLRIFILSRWIASFINNLYI